MVRSYGVWIKDTEGKFTTTDDKTLPFVKDTESITIKLLDQSDSVYCFIRIGSAYREYEKNIDNTGGVCMNIMERESHGEDIIEILEDLEFDLIH